MEFFYTHTPRTTREREPRDLSVSREVSLMSVRLGTFILDLTAPKMDLGGHLVLSQSLREGLQEGVHMVIN